ncbi:hypothetical protein K402DRAFT_463584 [Aulographum hederae CBS 113979]|uniref:Mediator of RNA polymerase II transcription subunit 20 n=1 Tax=Aulographum hederae CBS 113979 TaxID=1176131 RepID=A0A6G1H103_9PEZI|nr:hypothetical protein K402DRAFT_463584 [Aulographum hederae CBS 113979]
MLLVLHYIPDHQAHPTIQTLNTRLRTYHPDATALGKFSLEHRLLRSAQGAFPTIDGTPGAQGLRYQQLLTLDYQPGHQSHVHVAEVPPTGKGFEVPDHSVKSTTITIDVSQTDKFWQLLLNGFKAIWVPRAVMAVSGGSSWELGEFVIRMGELRLLGPQPQGKGVVVGVWSKDDIVEEERDATLTVMRVIGMSMSHGLGGAGGVKEFAGDDEVKVWCDLLRMRG